MPSVDHHIASRSSGGTSVTQPSMWYGGMSVGTRPSIRPITKNGAPSGSVDGSYQRMGGTGMSVRSSRIRISRYCSSKRGSGKIW
jgi:hypothetical protein